MITCSLRLLWVLTVLLCGTGAHSTDLIVSPRAVQNLIIKRDTDTDTARERLIKKEIPIVGLHPNFPAPAPSAVSSAPKQPTVTPEPQVPASKPSVPEVVGKSPPPLSQDTGDSTLHGKNAASAPVSEPDKPASRETAVPAKEKHKADALGSPKPKAFTVLAALRGPVKVKANEKFEMEVAIGNKEYIRRFLKSTNVNNEEVTAQSVSFDPKSVFIALATTDFKVTPDPKNGGCQRYDPSGLITAFQLTAQHSKDAADVRAQVTLFNEPGCPENMGVNKVPENDLTIRITLPTILDWDKYAEMLHDNLLIVVGGIFAALAGFIKSKTAKKLNEPGQSESRS